MNEYIKKKSFDMQSLHLSVIIFLILAVPFLIMSILEKSLISLIIFISISVLLLLIDFFIYFCTKREIIFTKQKILIKKNKMTKEINWHEIEIKYLGIDYIILLKCFSIELTYYNSFLEKTISFTIPSSRNKFLEIMNLRRN